MKAHAVGGPSDWLMPTNPDLSHAMWLPNPHYKSGLQIKTCFHHGAHTDKSWVSEWVTWWESERESKLINIRLHTIMWCIISCLTPIFKSIRIYILICVLKLCKQQLRKPKLLTQLLSSSWLISEPPVSSGVYWLDFSSASFVLSTKKSTVSALKWPVFVFLAEHQACYWRGSLNLHQHALICLFQPLFYLTRSSLKYR